MKFYFRDITLERPAVERCMRLLQTVYGDVAPVDPVRARRCEEHDYIGTSSALPSRPIGKPWRT